MPVCPNCGVEFDENKKQSIPYAEIIEDLNAVCRFKERGKKGFSHKSSSNQRLINGRWKDGYRLDDFKAVHRNMAAKWLDDPKMEQFLRPVTLYCASKFEGYLSLSLNSDKKADIFTALCDAMDKKEAPKDEIARKVGFMIGWDRVKSLLQSEAGRDALKTPFDRAYKTVIAEMEK